MTSDVTIKILRNCFSRFGLPLTVVSDNGPCFISSEFDNFMRMNGINHIKSAVYHPSTNGLAENMVKTLKITYDLIVREILMKDYKSFCLSIEFHLTVLLVYLRHF